MPNRECAHLRSRLAHPLGVATLLAAALVAGCAPGPELVPAPGAQLAPEGPGRGAMDAVGGVQVTARTEAWRGFPQNLDRVTPVLVTIDNEGSVPVRIRYNEFALTVPATGERHAAIPPYNIRGTEAEPINTYDFTGFRIAPYYARYYPGLAPYDGLFPFDQAYYDTYFPAWVDVQLPTGDMIQKALPEGVLEPGGSVSGFLYFENVDHGAHFVEFTDEVIDARNGERLGMIDIPFMEQ